MNNSDFGNDCRNNIDNCSFKPIFDDKEEISYIQKYALLYNNDVFKDFACPDSIKQQIEHECNYDSMSIRDDDPCIEARRHYAGQKERENSILLSLLLQSQKEKKSQGIATKKFI